MWCVCVCVWYVCMYVCVCMCVCVCGVVLYMLGEGTDFSPTHKTQTKRINKKMEGVSQQKTESKEEQTSQKQNVTQCTRLTPSDHGYWDQCRTWSKSDRCTHDHPVPPCEQILDLNSQPSFSNSFKTSLQCHNFPTVLTLLMRFPKKWAHCLLSFACGFFKEEKICSF